MYHLTIHYTMLMEAKLHVHPYMYKHTCTPLHVQAHMYTLTCTSTHVHPYMYKHTCVCIPSQGALLLYVSHFTPALTPESSNSSCCSTVPPSRFHVILGTGLPLARHSSVTLENSSTVALSGESMNFGGTVHGKVKDECNDIFQQWRRDALLHALMIKK